MATATKKLGRKQKHHVNSLTGEPVKGLTRRPDGRWRIIGTHQTFREPDEQEAIKRFYRISDTLTDEQKQAREIVRKWEAARQDFDPFANKQHPFWKKLADEIRVRPKWIAEATGIEWISYGPELKPPQPLPPLKELRNVWEKHAACSVEQMKKCRKAFDHFIEATGATEIKEITPELVIEYRDVLHNSGYAGKTQSHLIAGLRRVFSFAKERALAIEAINKAMVYLEILKPSEGSKSVDPKPIEVDEWKKLLEKSEGDDRAMILLMLNGSFYLGEVIELEWDDIKNGCIVTNREKTGQCIRVCVLWQETLDALAKVERRGDKIFHTYQGLPIKPCGAFRRFKALRDKAELSVTASQLRDGAYSAAVESGVSFQFCQLLNGHATGMADHYVKRNPKMVAPACEAIHRYYFE